MYRAIVFVTSCALGQAFVASPGDAGRPTDHRPVINAPADGARVVGGAVRIEWTHPNARASTTYRVSMAPRDAPDSPIWLFDRLAPAGGPPYSVVLPGPADRGQFRVSVQAHASDGMSPPATVEFVVP